MKKLAIVAVVALLGVTPASAMPLGKGTEVAVADPAVVLQVRSGARRANRAARRQTRRANRQVRRETRQAVRQERRANRQANRQERRETRKANRKERRLARKAARLEKRSGLSLVAGD